MCIAQVFNFNLMLTDQELVLMVRMQLFAADE